MLITSAMAGLLKSIKRFFVLLSVKIQLHTWFPFVILSPRGPKFKKTVDVLKIIKPGDIILRRYDNYLNNYFIPGFWKHVGLTISKRTVLHALNKGVLEEDLIQFCRTDHICIIRVKSATPAQTKQIIKNAKKFMGAKYDYDFDGFSDDAIYCSELVAKSIRFLFEMCPEHLKFLGVLKNKKIILPQQFFNDSRFEIIYIGPNTNLQ